jgi:ArsR family transcriptional regulator
MKRELLELLKALGDSTRMRIVHLIDQCGPEICVCDMEAVLDLPQSTISRQLMRLRSARIVMDSRNSMWVNYAIDDSKNDLRDGLLAVMRKAWATDPELKADKKKFAKLHAEQKIVRCKRPIKISGQKTRV